VAQFEIHFFFHLKSMKHTSKAIRAMQIEETNCPERVGWVET
jgi:hypothetical protein